MLNRLNSNAFILDTGATIHCVNDKSLFESIDENKNEIKVTVLHSSCAWLHACEQNIDLAWVVHLMHDYLFLGIVVNMWAVHGEIY